MEDVKNAFGVILLVLILLVFSVGGYFLMDYVINSSDDTNLVTSKKIEKEVRIDVKKDYVYFENTEELIDEVFKEDVILNFKGFEDINKMLHDELEALSKGMVSADDSSVPDGVVCDEGLYTFSYREYTVNQFGNYVSLLIVDYDYNCVSGSRPKAIKSYVVNKKTGILIDNDSLKKEFGTDDSKILETVKKRVDFLQTIDEDNAEVIEASNTIESFKSGKYDEVKALTISKNGKLQINYIVKSKEINYNDSIEID